MVIECYPLVNSLLHHWWRMDCITMLCSWDSTHVISTGPWLQCSRTLGHYQRVNCKDLTAREVWNIWNHTDFLGISCKNGPRNSSEWLPWCFKELGKGFLFSTPSGCLWDLKGIKKPDFDIDLRQVAPLTPIWVEGYCWWCHSSWTLSWFITPISIQ